MTTPSYPQQKPTLFTVIAVMTMANGIINLFWGLGASMMALSTVVGIFCMPLTILPTILGVFEIIYAAKLLSAQPEPIQPSPTLAAFEIACVVAGNFISLAVGILALVFYNDREVKEYFAQLNGTPIPQPVTPITPPAIPEPEVIPAMPEPAPAPEIEPTEPEKKTPRIRKVAGK